VAVNGSQKELVLSNISLVHHCNHYSENYVKKSFGWLFHMASVAVDCTVDRKDMSVTHTGKRYTAEGGVTLLKMAMALGSNLPVRTILGTIRHEWYKIGNVVVSDTFECPKESVFETLFENTHPRMCIAHEKLLAV